MTIFIIAMECEAQAIRRALGDDVRIIVSGVGKVAAAAATQRAISEFGATAICNVGLAGGFGDAVRVGGAYEVARAVEYDYDLAKLNNTRIGVIDGRTSPYFDLRLASVFPSMTLATGDRFNDSSADDALIAGELGASLRDMEGAAIAHVCELNRIPCYSLKVVSDVAGSGAMTGQYLANKNSCLDALADATIRWTAKIPM